MAPKKCDSKTPIFSSVEDESDCEPLFNGNGSDNKLYGSVTNISINQADDVKISNAKTSKCSKFIAHISKLTLEPVMFLYMFSFTIRSTCSTNLMLEKACRFHLKYPEDICNNLTYYESNKEEVEKIANNYNQYMSLIHMAPAAIVMIFVGPWSDKYGRKSPVIAALAFGVFDDIGIILNAYYYDAKLDYILLGSVPGGLAGGLICLLSTVYSMVTEITSDARKRTIRYALVEMAFGIGASFGAMTGGLLYKYYSYTVVFTVGAVFHALTVPWFVFVIKETRGLDVKAGWREKLRDFFSLYNITEGFRTCIKPRENYGRCQLFLLFLSMGTLVLTYAAFPSVAYVFVYHMFGWDPTAYANVQTIFSIVGMIFSVLCVPIFVRFFKVGDQSLGLAGSISMMAKNVIIAFSTQEWIYYIANVAGLVSGTALFAVRSRISKLVDAEELGKVFSFAAMWESLVPLFGTIAVLRIYNATVDFFPGMCYLVGGLVLVVPIFTFGWLICARTKDSILAETEQKAYEVISPPNSPENYQKL